LLRDCCKSLSPFPASSVFLCLSPLTCLGKCLDKKLILSISRAVAASAARLVYTTKLIKNQTNPNVVWWAEVTAIWVLAEFSTVILCGCFPMFPRFVKHLTGKDPLGTAKQSSYTGGVKSSTGHSMAKKKDIYGMDEMLQGGSEDDAIGPLDDVAFDGAGKDLRTSAVSGGRDMMGVNRKASDAGILRTKEIQTSSVAV
jgi:hypothetical protein